MVLAALVAALLGAAAGGGIGIAAGGKTTTRTVVSEVTQNETQTETVTETQTVRKPTQTVTAAAPAPGPSASAAGGTYSGNGDKNFGTIDVPTDSTLKWNCQCDPTNGFYLSSDVTDSGDSIDIQQSGSSGESAISAGTYHNVHSIGNGPFSFRIVPTG